MSRPPTTWLGRRDLPELRAFRWGRTCARGSRDRERVYEGTRLTHPSPGLPSLPIRPLGSAGSRRGRITEASESLFPECPSCGMATLHPGERSGWTCWNCGAAPETPSGTPIPATRGSVYVCRWCRSTSTRLVSEPGRTHRGVWQVFHCQGCGATHARYLPGG
ncbi:MAG TPA: hypothetical protein VGS23_04210 [Thermoplasmata archaeon]|nr:hypothetical protein [Thermoplasmata archaeon]